MITKLCSRCKAIINYPNTYCDICKDIVEAEREKARAENNKKSNKRYNSKRDPKYQKFYLGMDWKLTSRKFMQDKKYKCEECNKIASEVHHIIPIQTDEGWDKRLDYNNLQALCLECHNDKHNRFKRTVRRKGYL